MHVCVHCTTTHRLALLLGTTTASRCPSSDDLEIVPNWGRRRRPERKGGADAFKDNDASPAAAPGIESSHTESSYAKSEVDGKHRLRILVTCLSHASLISLSRRKCVVGLWDAGI